MAHLLWPNSHLYGLSLVMDCFGKDHCFKKYSRLTNNILSEWQVHVSRPKSFTNRIQTYLDPTHYFAGCLVKWWDFFDSTLTLDNIYQHLKKGDVFVSICSLLILVQAVFFGCVAMVAVRMKYFWTPYMCVLASTGLADRATWSWLLLNVGRCNPTPKVIIGQWTQWSEK